MEEEEVVAEVNTCWAVVAAELVSALLFIKKINKTYIEYSAQDILDFADPEKARNCNRHDHYCYTLSIRKGLHYVLREGLQKEEHRPYKRCRHASEIPARIPRDLAHIDGVEMLSFDEALIKLETQPIGASLHIFMPDYKLGIYRGPTCAGSTFRGMHAVSVIGVGELDGEKYFLVKSTHGREVGDKGYLKVSMEIMLAQIAKDNMAHVPGMVLDNKFVKPKPLILDFRCPTLHAK
ncbi:hypothetical protein EUTSA_v10026918mg, partial [Eutrema salsugineum]